MTCLLRDYNDNFHFSRENDMLDVTLRSYRPVYSDFCEESDLSDAVFVFFLSIVRSITSSHCIANEYHTFKQQ